MSANEGCGMLRVAASLARKVTFSTWMHLPQHHTLVQARHFNSRDWNKALKDAEEAGLEDVAAEATARLHKRKAVLTSDLQRLSNIGFDDAEQASGNHSAAQLCSGTHIDHECSCHHLAHFGKAH